MQRPVQLIPHDGWSFGAEGYGAYVSVGGERCTSGARAPEVQRAKCGMLPAFPLVRLNTSKTCIVKIRSSGYITHTRNAHTYDITH